MEAFVVDALPLKLLGGGVGGRAFRFVGDVVVVVTTIPSSLSVLLLLLAIVEASYSGNGSVFLVLLLSLPSEAGEGLLQPLLQTTHTASRRVPTTRAFRG